MESLYSRRSNLVIGFHGCDASVVNKVLNGEENLTFSTIKNPAVIGAIIDLGYCLDLTDSMCLHELQKGYKALVEAFKKAGLELPKNEDIGKSKDKLIRKLDCSVIQMVHQINREAEEPEYDSVKGVFWEGEPVYPNAGFAEKNHIQICVRNPNCIKGYFLPRKIDKKYPNP